MYKSPLYPVRKIKDLRDMIQQSEKLYADETAYLVKDEVNTKLVPYKHVRNVVLRDTEFPKNTSRKIKRYKS